MRCTSRKKMYFTGDINIKTGKPETTFRWKDSDKSIIPTTVPCGQCIACMLNYSREWALRCTHHAKMQSENTFITLTYSDKHLKGPTLQPHDFDLFLRRLRANYPHKNIEHYSCGEYGSKTTRPHWHALIFGWSPEDKVLWAPNKHGNNLYTSKELDDLWPYNEATFPNKLGEVDYGSAAYVARYNAKGLIHGTKQEQKEKNLKPENPKTRGLGKPFLERFYRDVFSYGYVIADGTKHAIPRYYERWFERNHPTEYERYVTEIKQPLTLELWKKSDKEYAKWINDLDQYNYDNRDIPFSSNKLLTKDETREIILDNMTKRINNQKGD